MRKKSISLSLKTIGYVAVGCVGLYFSMFLLKSVVALALAAGIAAASVVLAPAFIEALMYGKWKAMFQMWRGNPVFALYRNKEDMLDELRIREEAVTRLSKSVHLNISRLEERQRTHPEDAARLAPMVKKQQMAYDQQWRALAKARQAVEAYDEVIDRASWNWEMGQSVISTAGLLASLGGTDQVLLRQMREDVAMKAIAESAAEAMAQLDHLISGGADMVQTRHAQAEVKAQTASSHPETLILEQSPNKPGLFEAFSQKSEVKK